MLMTVPKGVAPAYSNVYLVYHIATAMLETSLHERINRGRR